MEKADRTNFSPASGSQTCNLAAIDIGTNSIHMVVVQIDLKLLSFTIIAREKDTVRLGDRELGTGNLTEEAMARSIAALKRCRDLAKSLDVDQIVAIATSATREAPNGVDFLKRIESELGLFVDLISGQEEARRIYLGVLSAMEFGSRSHVIIDIGGGSTELILADSREARFLSSTKIGAVRLTSEYITTDPISPQELEHLQAHIRLMLERPIEELSLSLHSQEVPRLVGTSGTIETLATIHALEKLGTVPTPLHGYEIELEYIKEMVRRLAFMTYEQRFAIPGINDKRAEIILAGALILQEAAIGLGLNSVMVCERALREGIIVDWMLSRGLIESRMRFQSEVRSRSVFKIAGKYQVKIERSERVAAFALNLFDSTRVHLHNWGERERQWLWTAAILHNCGVFVSHDSHHKHSYYLIRYGELLGFTEVELETIANIARYHRKSKPKKKHENYRNLPNKEYRQIVSHSSAILRIAIALDRRQIGAIKALKCEYVSEKRELHLYLVPARADDECALEMWSLNEKKGVFEEEFGVSAIAFLVPESPSRSE